MISSSDRQSNWFLSSYKSELATAKWGSVLSQNPPFPFCPHQQLVRFIMFIHQNVWKMIGVAPSICWGFSKNRLPLVVPSDGVFTRTHTAECAFCTVFYSVFFFSTMLPWGGEGGAGTTDVTDGTGGDVNVPCNLLTLLMLRHAGVGGMLAFHVTCSRCWCYATLGGGGC